MIPAVFHDRDEPAGAQDPHIWLDFDNAKLMINNIAQALQKKDPANKSFYKKNAEAYQGKLSGMDAYFKTSLANCASREIIYGGHYAFGYLAHRYGLSYMAAQGVSPDSEPTARDLAALVDQVRKDNVKYIFYEELTSPKIAETIANETNAQMLLLNAGHNVSRQQFEQGVSFIEYFEGGPGKPEDRPGMQMSMDKVVRIEDLNFSYGLTEALTGVSFTIDPGDYIGLTGPNGAGKTTLIKIILGLLRNYRGRVRTLRKTDRPILRLEPGRVPAPAGQCFQPAVPGHGFGGGGAGAAFVQKIPQKIHARGRGPDRADARGHGYRGLERQDRERAFRRPQQRVFLARALVFTRSC